MLSTKYRIDFTLVVFGLSLSHRAATFSFQICLLLTIFSMAAHASAVGALTKAAGSKLQAGMGLPTQAQTEASNYLGEDSNQAPSPEKALSMSLGDNSSGKAATSSQKQVPSSASSSSQQELTTDAAKGLSSRADQMQGAINRGQELYKGIPGAQLRRAQSAEALALQRVQDETARAMKTNTPKARSQSLAKANHDVNVARGVQQRIREGKEITKNDVDQVNDAAVREKLLGVVEGEEIKKSLKAEDANLLSTLIQLTSMAAMAAKNSQNLDTLSPNTTDPASLTGVASPSAKKDPISSTSGKDAKSNESISTQSPGKNADPELAAANQGEDSDDPAATTEKKELLHKGHQLREALKEKLAKYQALKGNTPATRAEAEALAAFDGRLGRDGTGASSGKAGVSTSDGSENDLLSVVGSSFQAAREAMSGGQSSEFNPTTSTEPGFNMPGSDTDAAVREMVDDTTRQLASPSGILPENSASLFERVHRIHDKCVKGGCVIVTWN